MQIREPAAPPTGHAAGDARGLGLALGWERRRGWGGRRLSPGGASPAPPPGQAGGHRPLLDAPAASGGGPWGSIQDCMQPPPLGPADMPRAPSSLVCDPKDEHRRDWLVSVLVLLGTLLVLGLVALLCRR